MHEYAAVQSLVEGLLVELAGRSVTRVQSVCLRRGSAFDPEALDQAWPMATAGTLLANASLTVEVDNFELHCRCGHRRIVTSDDLIGHMVVCPDCGTVRELDNTHDLAAVEVVVEVDDAPG